MSAFLFFSSSLSTLAFPSSEVLEFQLFFQHPKKFIMFRRLFGVVRGVFIAAARIIHFPFWVCRRRQPLLLEHHSLSTNRNEEGVVPSALHGNEARHGGASDISVANDYPTTTGDDGITVMDITVAMATKLPSSSSEQESQDDGSVEPVHEQSAEEQTSDEAKVQKITAEESGTSTNRDMLTATIEGPPEAISPSTNFAKDKQGVTSTPINEHETLKTLDFNLGADSSAITGTAVPEDAPLPSLQCFVPSPQQPSPPALSPTPLLAFSSPAQPSTVPTRSGLSRSISREIFDAVTPGKDGNVVNRVETKNALATQVACEDRRVDSDVAAGPADSDVAPKPMETICGTAVAGRVETSEKKDSLVLSPWEVLFGDAPRQSVAPRPKPFIMEPPNAATGFSAPLSASLFESYSASFAVGASKATAGSSRTRRARRRGNK